MVAQRSQEGGKVRNRKVILAANPEGMPRESDFKILESEMDLSLKANSGDVVIKVMFISLDPVARTRMGWTGAAFPFYDIGKPLQGGVVGKVIASENSEYLVGDLVNGVVRLSEYVIVPGGEGLKKIDAKGLPPSYVRGVCGLPGLSAWVGLKLIGQPKQGEQVYVSAAAGAVGQIVGQLAKIYGCRVFGSTSTDEKVSLMKEELGYDDAFNYKIEKDLDAALTKYFPNGIDIYFDNAGGETLDIVLNHINRFAHVPLCGSVSQYNLEPKDRYLLKNLFQTITYSARLEGFLVLHYLDHLSAYLEEVA